MADRENAPLPAPSQPAVNTRVSFDESRAQRESLSRRQSANRRRINDILETARERAEAVLAEDMGTAVSTSHSPRRNPALLRDRSSTIVEDEHNSSADERTGIVARGSELNYESTTTQTSTAPRARKVNSQRSQASLGARGSPPAEEQNGSAPEQEHKPGYFKFLDNFKSIELENKGSVARDHLALERTFLAWLRTSLAFASIGIAVTQLFRLNTSLSDSNGSRDPNMQTLRRLGKPLGATFLSISIIILFLGYRRYFQAQQWVMKGKFPASRGTIILVSIVALAVMVISLIVVIVAQPSGST